MAYDKQLAERVRNVLAKQGVAADEKSLMGGLCLMVNQKMCLWIGDQRLMVRLDPEMYDAALTRKGCIPMDATGRPMRGFVFITPEGMQRTTDLEIWIDLALDFNPRAKASKRNRTKPQKTSRRTARKSAGTGNH